MNKYGIDNIGFNKMIPKHKLSKLSIISDKKGIPININLFSGNIYDSKILNKQLNNKDLINEQLNKKEIFIADSGYDSSKIIKKLKGMKYNKILIPQNKRNIKNKKLIRKLTKTQKKQLKKRYIIEHKNNNLKSYKRLAIRYDKFSSSYMGFIYLACIRELIRSL